MKQAYVKSNGLRIIAMREIVQVSAGLAGFDEQDEAVYSGGLTVHWDTQGPVDSYEYEDEDGDAHMLDDIEFREESDNEDH